VERRVGYSWFWSTVACGFEGGMGGVGEWRECSEVAPSQVRSKLRHSPKSWISQS
jgi:hypothetical protein